MVNFVGAGCGAADLITVRGKRLMEEADVIIYAGSLVNRELLGYAKKDCVIYDSSSMTLEETTAVIKKYKNKAVVRLHTGDPSIYGALGEQTRLLDKEGIEYEICPGVSSLFGAAAALKAEYTVPGASQSLIITRAEGRTPVPESEKISLLAVHNASMAIFLSANMAKEVSRSLIEGGYSPDTPAALVYKASFSDEKVIRTSVAQLPEAADENGITKTALILIGDFLSESSRRSKLYDPSFSHGYRKGGEN